MTCPCRGKEGLDLAVCLAPPPGDHEVSIEVGSNYSIVVNSDGVFTRRILIDDTLPFAKSIMKPVTPETLKHLPLHVDEAGITCMSIRALIEAAEAGSLYARRRLEECKDIVENIRRGCD